MPQVKKIVAEKLLQKKSTNIQKQTLTSIKSTISPTIGLAIKYRYKLSEDKYKGLKRLLEKQYDYNHKIYTKRRLNLNGDLITMPKILPSLKSIKILEKDLQKLDHNTLLNGQCIKLKDWLNLAFTIPIFIKELDLTSGIISFKIGDDGYKLTNSTGAVNFYFTLFNLGELIHSPNFIFTLAVISGTENFELLQNNLQEFNTELTELQQRGIDLTIK